MDINVRATQPETICDVAKLYGMRVRSCDSLSCLELWGHEIFCVPFILPWLNSDLLKNKQYVDDSDGPLNTLLIEGRWPAQPTEEQFNWKKEAVTKNWAVGEKEGGMENSQPTPSAHEWGMVMAGSYSPCGLRIRRMRQSQSKSHCCYVVVVAVLMSWIPFVWLHKSSD